jgi:membrane-associated phospholipid phosphatase
VRRYGRILRVDDARLERAQAFFRKHGGKTVFLGRFVSIFRMLAALLAGVTCMPYGRFTLFNVSGGICWATLFGLLGYGFGRQLPQLERTVGQAGALIALFAALLLAVVLAGRWLVHHAGDVQAGLHRMIQRLGRTRVIRGVRERYPGAWAFAGRRFARGEYLGLHLTLGLLFSAGALWLFGGIAEDIIHHDPLTRFDQTVAELLHRQANPILFELAKGITQLGSPLCVAGWGLLVAVLLFARKEYLPLGGWAAALVGGALLDGMLKQIFHRPRPVWDEPAFTARGFSFPSGHAMGSLIAYGMLAYLVVRGMDSHRGRVAIVSVAVVLVLLIGLSRMYLGVHYFSDVIGGYAAGAVWLTACVSGLEVVRRRPRG